MLVKQNIFYWVCPVCGEIGGYCYDQSKMTKAELRYDEDTDNGPACPVCGEIMTVEAG